MRRFRTKPDQLDLFGPMGRTCPLQTPQWQNLPQSTRHKVKGLMARLLMEHDPNHEPASQEAARNLQSAGNGDV